MAGHDQLPRAWWREQAAAEVVTGSKRLAAGTAPSGALSRRYQRAGRDYRPWRMRTRAQRT
jgi:hypothetical protein